MRLGPASQWRPGTGRIVAWSPTRATAAAAQAAPPHPVGPSFLQRDHISAVLAQRSDGREHRGFTAGTITVDADLDEAAMTGALTAFVRAHEGLRSGFRIIDDAIVRYVVDPADIALVATESDETDPHRHLAERLPETAVFDAFPGCAFGAVIRPGSFDLYFGIDHAYGDGSSQVLGLLEILARYRGDTHHPLVSDDHGSHIEHTRTELDHASRIDAASAGVCEWRRVLMTSGGGLPRFPLPLGVDDAPAPVAIDTGLLADAATADQLAELAASHHTSMTAVIYAALALTQRQLSGARWFATAAVLSTRSGPHQGSQGWYCNFVPVGFEVRGDHIDEIIDDAAAAAVASRRALADPVHGALSVLLAEGAIDPSVVASPQMVTYMDFRWFPTPADVRDLLVFTGEGRTRNASLWISRDADGLHITTQRPDNPIAAESVARYFRMVADTLAASAVGSGAR